VLLSSGTWLAFREEKSVATSSYPSGQKVDLENNDRSLGFVACKFQFYFPMFTLFEPNRICCSFTLMSFFIEWFICNLASKAVTWPICRKVATGKREVTLREGLGLFWANVRYQFQQCYSVKQLVRTPCKPQLDSYTSWYLTFEASEERK